MLSNLLVFATCFSALLAGFDTPAPASSTRIFRTAVDEANGNDGCDDRAPGEQDGEQVGEEEEEHREGKRLPGLSAAPRAGGTALLVRYRTEQQGPSRPLIRHVWSCHIRGPPRVV
ncbi:MAG: hypothetical protein EBR86_15700 [Planctomycetia bacterium]|nr:hypothetical protein [Planctomycetia bacterium]